MTCREFVEFLMEYLDGALAPEVRQAVDRHLAVCPSCVAYLKSYEETSKLSLQAFMDRGQPSLPPVPEGLVEAILAAKAQAN